jgi:hypothetical protein
LTNEQPRLVFLKKSVVGDEKIVPFFEQHLALFDGCEKQAAFRSSGLPSGDWGTL